MWETITRFKECTLGVGPGRECRPIICCLLGGVAHARVSHHRIIHLHKLTLKLLSKMCHKDKVVSSQIRRRKSSTRKKNQALWLGGWVGMVGAWEGAMAAGKGRWDCHAYPSLLARPAANPQPAPNQTWRKRWCAPAAASSSADCCGSCRRPRKITSWVELRCCRGWWLGGRRRSRWRRQDLTLWSRTWRRSWQRAGLLQTSCRIKHFDNSHFELTFHRASTLSLQWHPVM